MGLSEREYYQDDYQQPPGVRLGERTMIINLVIVNALVYVANMLFGGAANQLTSTLALHDSDLMQPWMWWRFLTFGFIHDPNVARHILVNMFVLWMFGRDVEQQLGPRRLLRFYLIAVVLGGVLWAVRLWAMPPQGPHRLMGASGAVTAVFMMYVLFFPKRTVYLFLLLPVPAWVIGILYVVLDVAGLTSGQVAGTANVAYDVHLTGALFALVYWQLGRRGGWTRGGRSPRRKARTAGLRSWFGNWAWNPFRKRRPTLRVHEPDLTADAVTGIDEQADEILQKVADKGLDSLSPSERRILEAYSRRMQQKLR